MTPVQYDLSGFGVGPHLRWRSPIVQCPWLDSAPWLSSSPPDEADVSRPDRAQEPLGQWTASPLRFHLEACEQPKPLCLRRS